MGLEAFVTQSSWLRRALLLLAAGVLAVGFYLLRGDPSALRADPDPLESAEQHVELARRAESAKDVDEAVRQMQRALELEPGVKMLTQLGHLQARNRRFDEAVVTYEQAILLEPDDPNLLEWTMLANLNSGRLERAREILELQLAKYPEDTVMLLRLASVEKKLGDERTAVRHQREALRLGSDERAVRNDVAWALATSRDEQIRDPAEALRLAEALVSDAATRDPNEVDTLAAAYAAAGRFDDAVRTGSEAASLAAERGETQLSETIRSRVELYRSQRPYVDAGSSNGG